MLKPCCVLQPFFIFLVFVVFSEGRGTASALQDRLYDDYGVGLNGFVELRQGWRLQDDPYEKDASISEARLQLDMSRDLDWGLLKLKGDMVGDEVEEEVRGDLREFYLTFSPLEIMDAKMGRQVITWGTGDLLFINDLFPKDWRSFFIGRDDEYLKAPSDALRMSLFFDFANLDLVYGPVFNASDYVEGSRLSYWNGLLGRTAGRDFIFHDHERNSFFTDDEFALRVSKNISGTELAFYAYHGFWKTPEGMDPATQKLIYPKLNAFGASVRSPVFGGIGNLEIGYYDSREDNHGDDPVIRNSEFRFLAGFERELAKNFTGEFQYYLEWMSDYDTYRRTLRSMPAKDEYRHVLTLRLTRLLMNQNLKLSFFAYYSPSDQDAYLRPKLHYKITDHWAVEAGGNIFLGEDGYTFFGQFQDNTNAYAGLRWSF